MNSQRRPGDKDWWVLWVYFGDPHDSVPVRLFAPRYFDASWWRDHRYIEAFEVEYDYGTKVHIPWHAVFMYKIESLTEDEDG